MRATWDMLISALFSTLQIGRVRVDTHSLFKPPRQDVHSVSCPATLLGDFSHSTHLRCGRKRRFSPKKVMLTKIANTTRACSASSRMSRTQPVKISLRHISIGSQKPNAAQSL
eukprot:3540420-Prymnesium_polylepis.1